jgi:16S rRNA (adenine1518-N6/adenine1519-N6)-dimethyltransferase
MATPRLKKSLGQHHLRHGGLCRPLVEFLQPAEARVVEVGPGGGVLTRELLAAGAAAVVAWEYDLDWAFALRRQRDDDRLSLVVADALDLAWDRCPAETLVAGNLPYGIGTAVIERLLTQAKPESIPRAAFLVQLEVAERLLAVPSSPAYGGLSVLTAARSEPRLLGRVSKGSFRPAPKVDGAFVGLTLKAPPVTREEMVELAATIRLAFAYRRKTLRNSLAAGWGPAKATAVCKELGLEHNTRAQELALGDFVRLHQAAKISLISHGGSPTGPPQESF